MAQREDMDQAWIKQAAGIWVPFHEITGWSAAAIGHRIVKGAGNTLAMAAPGGGGGGGGMVLLDTQIASASATLDMVTGISDTYDEYELRFALVPANDNVNLHMRLSSNGGTSFDSGASDYKWHFYRGRSGAAGVSDLVSVSNGSSVIPLANNIGSDTGEGVTGHLILPTLRDTTLRKLVRSEIVNVSDVAEVARHSVVGMRASSAAFDGLRLFFTAGNLESGWARLYGIVK